MAVKADGSTTTSSSNTHKIKMMKPNPINITVTCDIPNPNHRCSPLIKYSSETNKAFDTSVGLATKE